MLQRETVDALVNPFWTHLRGDGPIIPCDHLVAEHPEGDPVIGPCLHMRLVHPEGHQIGTRPCTHVADWRTGRVEHSGGDPIIAPCAHWEAEHPEGHPTGATVPCIHVRQEHPGGHAGDAVPCVHPMPLIRSDTSRGVNYFTDDPVVQNAIGVAADRFVEWGFNAGGLPLALHRDENGVEIITGTPRPLSVFNREAVNGNPWDNHDPMWSHYTSVLHCIQITEGGPDSEEVVYHEMGHAAVGNSCVMVDTPGGPHTLRSADHGGLAVSEGWASFVALAMMHDRASREALFMGVDWEAADFDPAPRSAMNEYRVGCILWDLYDTANEEGDGVSLAMSDLFRVFSPTMATFTQGLVIRDLADYIDRLKANNPKLAAQIDAVVAMNLTPVK